MPLLNRTAPSRPTLDDLKTFLKPPSPTLLEGPLTLYRFGAGSTKARHRPAIDLGGARAGGTQHGKWWYDQAQLDELKDDWLNANYDGGRYERKHLLNSIRDGLAVARNWSNFSWFCRLRLMPGDQLSCFVGQAKEQPEWEGREDSPMLYGKATQYLVYDLQYLPPDRISYEPTTSMWMNIGKVDGLRWGR
jgi:hypothetical protein